MVVDVSPLLVMVDGWVWETFASDGYLRPSAGSVSRFYTDAACTLPVAVSVGSGEPTPGFAYELGPERDLAGNFTLDPNVYANPPVVGAPLVGPIYRREETTIGGVTTYPCKDFNLNPIVAGTMRPVSTLAKIPYPRPSLVPPLHIAP